MSEQRITATERLHDALQAIPEPVWQYDAGAASTGWDLALSAAETVAAEAVAVERVRVVEGLVATIKALDLDEFVGAAAWGNLLGKLQTAKALQRRVLAVVEAAREDTT